MFNQIMVPLDGSALAERALPCAERLARASGATLHAVLAGLEGIAVREVTLLRVIAAPQEGPEAERYLAAVARRLPTTLSVRCRVEQGDPAERIAAVAGTEALVVMATHGRIGLARWV